jgi:hypothetical protein
MYFFIQALGSRLEEMVQEDKQHVANIVSMVTEECRQKELLMEDEEEDFLDEGWKDQYLVDCVESAYDICCVSLGKMLSLLKC